MPQQRQFGTEISANTRKRRKLTPDERQRIIAKRECGVEISELAAEFGCSMSAIKYTIRTYSQRATTQDRPRSGRPPILSRRQKKIVYRKARAQPKIEYSELAEEAQFYSPNGTPSAPPSRSTLYRELRRRGLHNRRCKKRPNLTRKSAYVRFSFSSKNRNCNWRRPPMKFSDECSVQKGAGRTQEWAFKYSDERWRPCMITDETVSRRPAQMVWGCI